ncbi:MAG: group II intron reverse transcriptase/maturase [Planctomycetota bacterium]|jgi:RNA-directed DNA polymerase|nr:group II intron reverse transcriptase/maturase [Planctomycetota bacterium]
MASKDSRTMTRGLMEAVAHPDNLLHAFKRVKANKGAPGIDGMTVEELGDWLDHNLEELRSGLLTGSYQPLEVRGKAIPKPGGGERQLGIPTVLDRLVQQALLQELGPIFELEFSASSYGFRPGRSAHDALKAGASYAREGRFMVVDLDLEKFFDRVNHDVLMSRIARRVSDKRVLRLIRRFLNAGLMLNGVRVRREEGTPQGGPLSPLLANILLDDLDRELERRGHKFCRYADDVNIYVRSRKSGERVMASVARFLETRLKLKVNREKSAVDHVGNRKFLGYRILGDRGLGVHPQSVNRLKDKVRRITRRNRGRKFPEVVKELNLLLRGWLGYFHLGMVKCLLPELDGWIRRKLRCYRLKQLNRACAIARFLMSRGLDREASWTLGGSGKGWWRLSKTRQLHRAMGLDWFSEIGLLSLSDLHARLSA